MPDYSKKIVYLSQAQYQELVTEGTITVDGVTVTYNENDIYVTPQAEPVTDVKVNNASVTSNGVATIPIGAVGQLGVVKDGTGAYGVTIRSDGIIQTAPASEAHTKSGGLAYGPIVPATQHFSTFYGLSKVAGADLANETVTVGTYPDSSKAAIQHMLGTDTIIAPNETDPFTSAHAIGELFTMNGKLYRAKTAIAAADAVSVGTNCEEMSVFSAFPHDVQVNGTSVVTDGVANVPRATNSIFGVVRPHVNTFNFNNDGVMMISGAAASHVKEAASGWRPIMPNMEHGAAFYGLAKAAGDTTQSASSNAVGTYTASAKNAIHTMLGTADLIEVGFVEEVSGATPSITGQANYRYVCGEVTTISITPPSAGSIDVVFESGSTASVLTVPNTVKWPTWFDPTDLDANTIYELLITDATYGSVMTWAT